MTDPATPTATPLGKPARSRKPRAKPPAAPKVERAKRTTKARTLRRRIDDLGAYCLEAFDRARKSGGEAYEKSVRDALDVVDELEAATTRHIDAKAATACATARLNDAQEARNGMKPILDRLYASAKVLAGLDHPAPETPTPLLDPDGRDEGAET